MTYQISLPFDDEYHAVARRTSDWEGCITWVGYVMLGDSIVEVTNWAYIEDKDDPKKAEQAALREARELMKMIQEDIDDA